VSRAGSFFVRHAVILTALGTVVVVIVLATLTPTGRDVVQAILDGNSRELRRLLLDLGVVGVVALGVLILSHAVVPFPSELVTGAAAFVYGFWLAVPMLLVFWLASALLAYWLAERFGRPLARRLVGQRRLIQAEDFVARGGAAPLLSLRLIPIVPYNAVCYAAGITRVPLGRYSWTTVVGILPLTVLVAYLGSRLRSPDFSDPRIWLLVAAFIAIVVAGQVMERRLRHRRMAPGAETEETG
jgi:uncharacterized membrane protein YdjX (TVP38/TMEM64 family)